MTVVYSIESDIDNTSQRLQSLLEPLGGLGKLVRPGDRVLIKPNLVAPFPHAVTDLSLIASLVEQIYDCGGKPLIGESSGFEFDTETTFRILGINDLARRLHVQLVNFEKEPFVPIKLEGLGRRKVRIPRIVLETDKLINIPKLKRHSLTKATIGIKNLFGLLDYASRRSLHTFGLERGIFALGQTIIPDLVIVDGSVVTARAVYGQQTKLNLLAASQNITSMDVFCCQYLNLNWRDVEHIKFSVEQHPSSLQFDTINVSKTNENDIRRAYSAPFIRGWNDSLSKKIHRLGYQAIYFFDIIYNRIRKHHSIVPVLHYYFGIRPILHSKRCNECGHCLSACPVDAIHIHERRIDARRCMSVRCLACIPACPENAISVRGRDVDPSMIQTNE